MKLNESDRIATKLLALNLRLAELDSEMQRTQLRVARLEAELESARLASLFGEEASRLGELSPQLEQTRLELDSQQQIILRVRQRRRETQVLLSLTRRREQAESRLHQAEGQP
jgi:hypothetical protein